MEDSLNCSLCGGPLELLGRLGQLNWFRCRNCGMEHKTKEEIEHKFPEELDTYSLAVHLWRWYFAMAELNDRALPGHMGPHDTWLPIPPSMRESLKYAKECKNVVEEARYEFGISNAEWIAVGQQVKKERI